MSVNPLHCPLSLWDGDNANCRVCNCVLPEGRSRYCGGECLSYWRSEHRYFLSRQIAVSRALEECGCVAAPHSVCAMCGLCEGMFSILGRVLTVDHLEPRMGETARFGCLHHTSNLQVLCSHCHEIKTKLDELYYLT